MKNIATALCKAQKAFGPALKSAIFPSPAPKDTVSDIESDIGTIQVPISGAPDIEADIEAESAKMK